MSDVITSLTMSLDGFIAHPDDTVGGLFDWYRGGDVLLTDFGGRESRLTPQSAAFFRAELDRVGAFLVGRRLYDLTGGWGGRPPVEAPMVVVTHAAPAESPPTGGVPITFATDGIEAAVTEARELAGDGVVSVAGAKVARKAASTLGCSMRSLSTSCRSCWGRAFPSWPVPGSRSASRTRRSPPPPE